MQCPACKVPLRPHKHSYVEFEICPQCRGIYVDAKRLHGLAVNVAIDGQVKSDAALTFKPRKVMRPLPKNFPGVVCPRCGADMKEFNYAYDSNVFVDRCDQCGGIWLDPNEIIDIAKHVQYNPEIHEIGRYLTKKHEDTDNDMAVIAAVAGLIATLVRMLLFR
jgi:Zn-finger nucleic acid-binding protein